MKCTKFSPETEFEVKNLEIIEKLRKINDEELTNDFNKKFFEKLSRESIKPIPGYKIPKMFIDAYKNIIDFKRPILIFGSICVIVCLVAIVSLVFNIKDDKQIIKGKEYVGKVDSNNFHKDNDQQEKVRFGNSQRSVTEINSLKERYKIFVPSLKNRLLYIPNQSEFVAILESKKYKYYIKQITLPTFDDSVQVLIDILQHEKK